MVSRNSLMATIFAGMALVGCDSVEFPGFTQAERSPVRDANAETGPVNETAPQPVAGSVVETPVPQTPAPETPANDVSGGETFERDPAQQTGADTTSPEDRFDEFADITDLLEINAAKCASSGQETQTLAEIANADAAVASVTIQTVNGTQVTTDTFPGIVKMEPRRILESGSVSSGHCGATRIAENWFVTASHCLDDTYDEIRLIATESDLRDPRATIFEATASLCHHAYGGQNGQYSNDIALIAISDETAASLTTVPIARYGETDRPLGPSNYPNARMAGWGLVDFELRQLSDQLLRADLGIVSSGPAAITVSSTERAGPCIGDSGGPLIVDELDGNPRVIGVLSVVEHNKATRQFCMGDYNARYTNLAGYTDWMDAVIGTCSANPALCARD